MSNLGPNHQDGSRRGVLILLPAGFALAAALAMFWLPGCASNDPFDPATLANQPPVVRMSVTPFEGGELSPTSYFQRHFSWFGSDQDGWVQEYYVSIRNDAAVAAPWDTTTSTDTTMTFITDDEGNAQATFLLVCRDDRGALSDTLVQFIPLQNFPPAVNFQTDFDPLRNMQRDITDGGTAAADTVYWNWGASNFRLFALDLDGGSTMDTFYRYTVSPTEPTETYDIGDPQADPLTTWVRVAFPEETSIREFELFVSGLPVGPAQLTVSVTDEANADTRFTYNWEVRAPKSNIIYVKDNTSSIGRALYGELMDSRFGEGNWDLYDFWFGFPDHPFVVLESFRKFDAVIWSDGGVTSPNLTRAASTGGVLDTYLYPRNGEIPGKLLIASSALTGSVGLPATFHQKILGIGTTGSPPQSLLLVGGNQALGEVVGLPALTSLTSTARGIGLNVLSGSEALYRMEYCETARLQNCYNVRAPEPFDPIMAVRRPDRQTSPLASAVGFSMQLENFSRAEVIAALTIILDTELGVPAP